MKLEYKHLDIAALAAILFVSVYLVFSLMLQGAFIVSFLFIFESVLCTLALLSVSKAKPANTKLTLLLLLLFIGSLFVFILTHIKEPNTVFIWFYISVICNAILLSPPSARRLNLITLCLYWAMALIPHDNTLQLIESALSLTLITILITVLSQITKELKNNLDISRKTDTLTGCIEANEFKTELAKVTQLYGRYKTPFSLIFVKYEASFSSEKDLLIWLKELAQLYQSRLRKTDILCRFSSQKFIILLPSTTQENAISLCSDLKRCAEAYEFTHQKHASQCTGKTHLIFETETYSEKDNLDKLLQRL